MTDMLIRTAGADTADLLDGSPLRPGLLVLPGDAAWDGARAAWNLAVDQRPAAVALPASVEDVVDVVRYARDRGLRVAAQGTGHNAAPLGDLGDVVLVRTHLMRGVHIDPDARVARVEAGALWSDVVGPAARHGLAALHGSSADVGVIGYTLGGGVSWYSRRYGLAASRVLAVELVTAGGVHVRTDRRQHRDLFWALLGGGGSFGVVTHMEFELLEIPSVHAGGLWFPAERATEVLQAWREWAAGLNDRVATSARILNVPPAPDVPEAIRGRSFALVLVAVLGDGAEADRHLARFRAMGPVMDTVGPATLESMTELAMDPPAPIPAVTAHAVFDALSAEAIDTVVTESRAASTLVVSHLTLGGGAMARRLADGARTRLDAPVLFFAAALAPPELAATAEAEMSALQAALAPHAADRDYLNFREQPADPRRFWDAETYARLQAVKRAVDPEGIILANHAVTA